MCRDWRVEAASKLGVPVEDVEKAIESLANKRLFVHFRGEPPRVEGVEVIRVFREMGVVSAVCSADGLRRLLSLDSVVRVEPVHEVAAHGSTREEGGGD